MTDHERCRDRVEELFARFNPPVIPIDSIYRWLDAFDDQDQAAALTLLDAIEFHSQPRLAQETRLLHARLQQRLEADGFDHNTFRDVDFSREFTCKSGDVVSFIYRKANLIRSIDFKTFDQLAWQNEKCATLHNRRALVILDDYIGTGSQFIFQFIGKSRDDIAVVNNYRKTYLTSYIIHQSALQKFGLLKEGKTEQVIGIEQEQFPDVDFSTERESLRAALVSLDWDRIELVCLEVEQPLLSDANRRLTAEQKDDVRRLLEKYRHPGYSGTSYLGSCHTFFYGAPNALPEILWPLFKRFEDLSVYAGGSDALIAEIGEVTKYSL